MEIRLLGPLAAIADDGAILPVGGGKQGALLAALALEAGQTLSDGGAGRASGMR